MQDGKLMTFVLYALFLSQIVEDWNVTKFSISKKKVLLSSATLNGISSALPVMLSISHNEHDIVTKRVSPIFH